MVVRSVTSAFSRWSLFHLACVSDPEMFLEVTSLAVNEAEQL